MFNFVVTPNWLLIVLAGFMSLGFSYIPGLDVWYAAKPKTFKQLVQVGIIFVVIAVVFGLQCANLATTNLVCTVTGVESAITTFVLAVMANQGLFSATPQTDKVVDAKTLTYIK